jgi:hypothetical protein
MIGTKKQKQVPCPRAGHTAVIIKNHMFVFGGKDSDGMKLNDMWSLNIRSEIW